MFTKFARMNRLFKHEDCRCVVIIAGARRSFAKSAGQVTQGTAPNPGRASSQINFSSMPTPAELSDMPSENLNLCNAVNQALRIALESDDSALLFGEDVGFGGVFRCSDGLQNQFGEARVFSTPLSEQGIVGFGIGIASVGHTAIAEIQFADYIFPAHDQIVNEASKFRYRSASEFDCGGLTVRAPYGAVGHGGLYHSQSVESFFANCAGIKMVFPRSPYRAKGLLLASIRDPNPTLFFEPKRLYRAAQEDVPIGDYTLPLGVAEIVEQGDDVTVVSWGAQVLEVQKAAELARSRDGISVEIIDLQTLLPWDQETVEESVQKTGRLVVTHEAAMTGGFAGEIISAISESCFLSLEAPPLRVCGYDTPFALIYEKFYYPDQYKIYEAIRTNAKY